MANRKLLTLAFILNEDRILLGYKKRGFGQGKWNGFGGKVEMGETILQAAERELFEESGITTNSLEKYGILEFEFVGKPTILEVHVYASRQFSGKPTESGEMRPQWFKLTDIPYRKMWLDDQYWLPLLLKGSKFKGEFKFEGHSKILSKSLQIVDSLEDVC